MGSKRVKIITDAVILVCSGGMALFLYLSRPEWPWLGGIFVALLLLAALAAADMVVQGGKKEGGNGRETPQGDMGVSRLILLDQQDKPVKEWELSGRTFAVIGRQVQDGEEEVDIDLGDCEYGTFIDPCHAVLNFCLDSWYIEDLGSRNGVKVRKVEDGACYKVLGRPCKISAGDILYIANTRLLLT